MRSIFQFRLYQLLALILVMASSGQLIADSDFKLLFLGDGGHHQPIKRFEQIVSVLDESGITVQYTDDLSKLNSEQLNKFDGLILFANIDAIEKQQADALLEYVTSGHGFIPLHCATYCFRNDVRIVALMGAQFKQHGGEVFSTVISAPNHPIMNGFDGFRSWDETYVHHKHNEKNRTVLEYRLQGQQAEGKTREPWTWTRTHGKGRVFYTAWGHDERTWSEPGFQNLLERGIRWACGGDPSKAGPFKNENRFDVPEMTAATKDLKPFDYVEVGAKIPHYIKSDKWGVQAPPLTKMQLPLPAEESLKHYITPRGFHLELYASEKNESHPNSFDGKPIAMNWDERGRLFVCETVDYPNELQPANRGRDRIRICEDTDGDAVADKWTVFAEDLSIPTAITFHRGGVIVQNGTETLWLKDTDGDDIADQREVIISNWTLGDTHGGVSNFRYGHDNWFWAMQGYNNSSPIITATGEKVPSFRMGFWRFKLDDSEPPKVTDLEFLRSSNNNTWGLGLSEEGLVFGSTANGNPSMFMPIPNRYYEQVRGWGPQTLNTIADSPRFQPLSDRVRQVDHFGNYTAAAGHALYTARNYPQQWWNRTAFVCGPTGKLVGTFVLSRNGSDYTSTSPFNLVASDDEWAAPIAAEVGPDGNVWILDWYNYVVQHNPTPKGFKTGKGAAYESDLRDKKHGRIYRLLHDANKNNNDNSQPWKLPANTPTAQLIAALKNPTMLVRLHAQRLLVERNDSGALKPLRELIADESTDEINLNVGAIHSLWTLRGMDAIADDHSNLAAVLSALKHPSAGVRRAAIQVLPTNGNLTDAVIDAGLLSDDDAQVRLAAVLALADVSNHANDSEATSSMTTKSGSVIAAEIMKPETLTDPILRDAYTSAVAAHALPFLSAMSQFENAPNPLVLDLVKRVAEHIARGEPTADEIAALLDAMKSAHPELASATMQGISTGWRRDHRIQLSGKSTAALVLLFDRLPAVSKANLVRLASAWGTDALDNHADEIVKALLKIAENGDAALKMRTDSVQQLLTFQPENDEITSRLIESLTPQAEPEYLSKTIDALTESRAKNLGPELITKSRSVTPTLQKRIIRTLLARAETTQALLNGIDSGAMRIGDLSLDQKRGLSEHPNKAIRERATKLLSADGGLPNADRQKVIEAMLKQIPKTSDVKLGQQLYVKHCSKCHQHGKLGEAIGPNLTGMSVHPAEELLIHILDPSRSVEGNFRQYTIVTIEGRILTGMLASETRTSVELIDNEAKRHTLARADIEDLISSAKSVMPEGFEKQMKPAEMANLLAFLTAKGKYVPLDLRKAATIVSTKPMFYGQSPAERLIFPDWKPKMFKEIPFVLIDPRGDTVPNIIMLHGPNGTHPPKMPKQVRFPVNTTAKTIHILGGVGGWNFPAHQPKSTSLIVRLHYANGTTEDHELKNGIHYADYIRRVDVPESEFAFNLNSQQLRYLTVTPNQQHPIQHIELIKGNDPTAPIVVSITVERP